MREPSYTDGYYSPHSGFKGEKPTLWDGCVIAFDAGLGNTGGTVFDHSGHGNHGTLTGALSTHWVTDSCGTSLDFPDSGDYLNVPYSETFASKCYSWSIWIRSAEAGGNLGLISRWQNSGGTYSWVVTWEAGGGIYWYQAGLSTVAGTTVVVHDGSWHHLAGTYDKATTKLYLDGVEKHSVANTGDYTATTQPLVLGTYATSQDWDGKIRGFAFWDRGLTAAEVLALATDPSVMYRVSGRNSRLYAPPVYYEITSAVTGPVGTLAAAMTFTAPVYAITSAVTGPAGTLAAAMTFTAPIYAITSAVTGPAGTLAAAMTFTAPVYAITSAMTGPAGTLAAAMTFTLTTAWKGTVKAVRVGQAVVKRKATGIAGRSSKVILQGEEHENM